MARRDQGADLVLVHSPTEDGEGVRVLRAKEGHVEAGEMRPLAEGRPLSGEVVRLRPRPESPRLFESETVFETQAERPAGIERNPGTPSRAGRGGPPQVASDRYRKNWDAIWRGRRGKRPLLN